MVRVVGEGESGALEAAVRALESDGVVVVPTDTVYGLAARADCHDAIQKIFAIKMRPASKPLPVLVRDVGEARRLARLSDDAARLAGNEWPGPLTIVVPAIEDVSFLGGDGKTIALRAPNHKFLQELLATCGPLAATSANLSGRETPKTVNEVTEQLEGAGTVSVVDLYVDGGTVDGAASRVISFIGGPKILR